ncbi:Fc receptor-like protein 4 [Passer montanus]|uniref:Fc receptor-like protein 4 n=1 Tax=Passer montanus TaxID=9160 RepID=UPI00195FE9F0|nr:Fc receptor-like protein 4 [Passer montanus]
MNAAAQTFGLAGSQTTQLLVEPPWRPAVLWEPVTLTCQGSGTDSATKWYRDGLPWGQEGHDYVTVTDSGTYWCGSVVSVFSLPVRLLDDPLVLQVPAQALLEGDTVTLRCRGWQDNPVTRVRFYQDVTDLDGSLTGTELSLSPLQGRDNPVTRVRFYQDVTDLDGSLTGTELSLSPLQLNHSSLYCCRGQEELFLVPVLEAPLLHMFYHDRQVVGVPEESPQLLVPVVGVSHSGNYSCQVRSEGGNVRKSSARFRVTGWAWGAHKDPQGPLSRYVHVLQTPYLCPSITPFVPSPLHVVT